ncbi:MAG: penicillin-binding protein 2 [Candidatus Doudnabacteria bacterium]|nr:penicillin-binding protein 2 [Candidatus Doudnabacteria bacterium]
MMNRPSVNLDTPKNSYNLRIFLLLSALTLFIIFMVLRMFNLQILSHAYYKNIANNQHGSTFSLTPNRGEIFLTTLSGNPVLVATNVTKNMVYAVPKEVTDEKDTANKLAKLLELDAKEIVSKLSGDGSFVMIKKQIEDDTAKKLEGLKLKGIYMQEQDVRLYPEKDLAAQVIGFLGYDSKDRDKRVGQYGIEGKYDKQLAGNTGVLDADTDPLGRWITTASRSFVPAADGDDIYLTIDPTIQFKAEEILKSTLSANQADQGTIVVINPKTGAVMAMANVPEFDLNNYGKVESPFVYNNNALIADYEPGSVFKPLTLAAAMNERKITPQTTYKDEGQIQIDDKIIKNSNPVPLGEQNMIQVLVESLNTGAVFAEQQIGNDTFKKYLQRFGFGKPVDVDLPGQAAGNLKNLDRKGDIFFATASYGQGITATPLQLVQAYTALANGGKMMTPYIVNKIVHDDGSENMPRPQTGKQVLDVQTAAQISAMMVDVVENGHGKRAAVPGYYIAGKTGTAQVASKDKSGYDPNMNIGTFIGFGPRENPQFLALVRIDNPKNVNFAETTAAPAFGQLASFILNYLQVPPTR